MPINPRPPADQQENPYEPPGPRPLVFDQFQGINTNTTRPGVPDEQAFWLDSFMPFGPRELRVMPDLGLSIFTLSLSNPILCFNAFNIGINPYLAVFPHDGSIWAVRTDTIAASQIAPPGTIANPDRTHIGVTQWGNQYVIITSNQNTNGYFIWDGVTFYLPGAPAPGGGTMPTAISGNAVETYAGRVWVVNGASVFFTAPGSFVDFTTGNGGGSFRSTDSFLQNAFVGIQQTNGFLYLIGDSSINYISGVNTVAGSPPVTSFTNQNIDPEVGSLWPGTIGTWGRNIIFANSIGAHVAYGANATKISEMIDGVFTPTDVGVFLPSAAKVTVFNKKLWCMLVNINNPLGGSGPRLMCWDGKRWWAASQNTEVFYIGGQEINSVFNAYGTDSVSIFPLFTTPSSAVTKIAVSKMWDVGGLELNKAIDRVWGAAVYNDARNQDITVNVDSDAGASATVVFPGPGTTPISPVVFGPQATGQQGSYIGVTVFTNCPDLKLISVSIPPQIVGYRG